MGKECGQKSEEIDAARKQRGKKWGLAMTAQGWAPRAPISSSEALLPK